MFDFWIGKINLTALMLVVSVVIILPVQLLLCFKVRSRRLRCMPAVILLLAAAADVVMYIAASGWKRLIFRVGVMYMALMLFTCAAGWIIWAVVKRMRGAS